MSPQPPVLGKLVAARRKAAGLSRAALALKANLSESTLKNLEADRHQPSQATLNLLLAIPELRLTPAELLSAPTVEPAPSPDAPSMNCLILPGFDPIAMAHDLSTRLAGRGGACTSTPRAPPGPIPESSSFLSEPYQQVLTDKVQISP